MSLDGRDLGELYGKVAFGDQDTLVIVGSNRDVSVGEIFMITSKRAGHERVFFFRVLGLENYLRQVNDMAHVASTLMVEGDAYLAGIERNMLLAIVGKMLGYAEMENGEWVFRPPRRLPDHLADVYRPVAGTSDELIGTMLASQTGGDVYVGTLHVGEITLNIPVYLPVKYLPMHVGIFGSTGAGKSNLMMVLIKGLIDHNLAALRNNQRDSTRISAFCIDPHDEFAQGIDKYGIQHIVEAMDQDTRSEVIGDFYYLTAHRSATPREIQRYARDIRILWSEILPRDLYSIMEFTPQMEAFIDSVHAQHGDRWISTILEMTEEDTAKTPAGTLRAVQRRLDVLQRSSVFIKEGLSLLTEIFKALETGRILIVNTSLLSDMEQFLLTTVVTRTLSDLRRSAKSSGTLADLERQSQMRLPSGFFDKTKATVRSLYTAGGAEDTALVKDPRDMPVVMITVEEAPSILNPRLMAGQSVFKDIARQGRKFNIGLLVISQQVSVLDNVILSQMNTELNLRLGNEREIAACIDNASVNISGFENEFRVMSRGDALLTASYREMPIPLKIPKFDDIFESHKDRYASEKRSRAAGRHTL